jgi:hypothetical protein
MEPMVLLSEGYFFSPFFSSGSFFSGFFSAGFGSGFA